MKTSKYSDKYKNKGSIKTSNSHDANADGNITGIRALEPSTSPFRMDHSSTGSIKKTHLASKPVRGGYVQTY